MGSLLESKNVYQSIDAIEMNQRDKAKAKARMRKADAIANVLWGTTRGLAAWLGSALAKPVQTVVPALLTVERG